MRMLLVCTLWSALALSLAAGTERSQHEMGNVSDLLAQVSAMRSQVQQMEALQVQESGQDITELVSELKLLTQKQKQDTEAGLKSLRAQIKPKVQAQHHMSAKEAQTLSAFSICMFEGNIELDDGQVVPFNREITNVGSHFSLLNNRFTSPTDAVYYFSLCVNNGPTLGSIKVRLMIDGEPVAEVFTYYTGPDGYIYEQACVNVIETCSAGQEVWAECADACAISGFGAGHKSMFTGVYLFAAE